MNSRYEIKFPVRYDKFNYRIIDAEMKVICRPWQITGMQHNDVHERGEFLVEAINKNKPEEQKTIVEKVEEKVIQPIVETVKKRGRPKGK